MARARARLLDVAARAGVSPATASFVLTGRDMRISAEAKERVLRAASELHYRPNLAARGLRTNITSTVGLVSDTIASQDFAGGFIRGAVAAALELDHLLVIGETEANPEVEAQVVRGMLDRQVDGLVYGTMFTRRVRLPQAAKGHPVVLLNCLAPRLPGPAVLPDERQAGATAARALLQAGHGAGIWLVGELPRDLFAARERSLGIRAELSAAGVRLAGTLDCGWSARHAYEAVSGLLAAGRRPRACICFNDRTAMGVYQAVQAAGLDIPGDVSVVSFDDSDLASWLRPQLTSVALPHHDMGHLATRLLIKRELERVPVRVPMPLRARASVGPPRAGTARGG
jgi:LacI family transcriptional regulator